MKVLQSSMLEWPGEVSQWSRYRDDLSVVDGVVLFKERPVIPVVMRPEVLSTLHAGHQGVTRHAGHGSQLGLVAWDQ